MNNFSLPIVAAVVLLVMLSLILLRHFLTSRNTAQRRNRRPESLGEHSGCHDRPGCHLGRSDAGGSPDSRAADAHSAPGDAGDAAGGDAGDSGAADE